MVIESIARPIGQPTSSSVPLGARQGRDRDRVQPSVVGLFAGIGGFELAFAGEGFGTSTLAELDPAAQAVLAYAFPEADIVDDVRDVTSVPVGTQIVTAGFPCQNLSMAGDKSGINGFKSGAVEHLFAILERSDVSTVVVENVYFMLHLDRGRAMHLIVTRFRELGYRWAYRVVDTVGFGLPHRRRRVYLVASRHLDPRAVLFADDAPRIESSRPAIDRPIGFYWTEGEKGSGLTVDGIPPLKVGSSIGIPSAPAVLFPDGAVLMPSVTACEALQGFPKGWTDPARADRRDPRRRLLGNAVSVPAAAWVASRIAAPSIASTEDHLPLVPGSPWPNAAFDVGDGVHTVSVGSTPLSMTTASIQTYRDDSWTPLSERALAGFLSRAHRGNLWYPDGFLEALDAALPSRRSIQVSASGVPR